MNTKVTILRLMSVIALLCIGAAAMAQCDLKVVSAYTCNSAGKSYSPQEGDIYYVRINWTVTGTPKQSYSVKFTEANLEYTMTGLPAAPGSYWMYAGWQIPLAGPIPYSFTLDPSHVTGDTNLKNNVLHRSFTPISPTTAISYYNSVERTGTHGFQINWQPGSGTITHGFVLLGDPVSDSFQQVLNSPSPSGAILVNTQPDNQPVWQMNYKNYTLTTSNDQWDVNQTFTVSVSNVRVNPTLLQKVTWAQLGSLPANISCWLQADPIAQSSNIAITQFVTSVLPSNYRYTMSPYQAARKLFLAIVKRTAYKSPPGTDGSAIGTLNAKVGDCGGFSNLIVASLRNIGIPARTLDGFWVGTDQWHVIMEFYLPGCGWVPADGSSDKLWNDPSGVYACMFGFDPELNQFCAVGRGGAHNTNQFQTTSMQVGWFYYWGAGISNSYVNSCSLQ